MNAQSNCEHMPCSTLLSTELWQTILEEVLRDGRSEFTDNILPVCRLFNVGSPISLRTIRTTNINKIFLQDLGWSLLFRHSYVESSASVHRLAQLFRDHPDHGRVKCIKCLHVDLRFREWRQDSIVLTESLSTILLRSHLQAVVFRGLGIHDDLASYLLYSSKYTLRHMETDIENQCLSILGLAPQFTNLNSLALTTDFYYSVKKFPAPTLSTDFREMSPLHIPTVRRFVFLWDRPSWSIPARGLLVYIGAARFAITCELDIRISNVDIDPSLSAALDPLFVHHRSRKVALDINPMILPSTSFLSNSKHVTFLSMLDEQLFDTVSVLPEKTVIQDCGSPEGLWPIFKSLLQNPSSFSTGIQIKEDDELVDFTRNYWDDDESCAIVGQILFYAVRLAPKGINIIDRNGLTWRPCELLGPLPGFGWADND
jgi:hypothetical protein